MSPGLIATKRELGKETAMARLVEMDARVTVFQQMNEKGGPVVLINKFDVSPEDIDRFLAAWTADAAVMKREPGFVSTQLHRGIAGSSVFINYAVWESTEHFKRAFGNPEFQSTSGCI
jgi:heme-degrading monooxygenase HmoA